MNKLFFNPKTKSIVFSHGKKYYDMQNGQEIEYITIPYLKPFNTEFRTKWVSFTDEMFNTLTKLGATKTETGYKLLFKGATSMRLDIKVSLNKCCLVGNFPYYFLKSFLTFISK